MALTTSWRGTPADRFLPNFRRRSDVTVYPRDPACSGLLDQDRKWAPDGERGTRNSKSPTDIDVPALKQGGSRHFRGDTTAVPRARKTISVEYRQDS